MGAAIAAVEELDRLAERQPWPIDEDLSSESGDEEESADSEIEERAEYQAKVLGAAMGGSEGVCVTLRQRRVRPTHCMTAD